MILFTIVLLTLLLLIGIGVVSFSAFGAGVIIVFGDVIVCIILFYEEITVLKEIGYNGVIIMEIIH